MLLSASRTPAATLRELRLRLLGKIASCEVANRPGRFEPRVIKRRKHRYPLMKLSWFTVNWNQVGLA